MIPILYSYDKDFNVILPQLTFTVAFKFSRSFYYACL